jgi:hypothetical protein
MHLTRLDSLVTPDRQYLDGSNPEKELLLRMMKTQHRKENARGYQGRYSSHGLFLQKIFFKYSTRNQDVFMVKNTTKV